MGLHSTTALREIEDSDLARYMRLAGSMGVVDTARVVYDDNCFILRKEDGLVKHLGAVARGGAPLHTVRMSMSCTETEASGVDTSQDGKFEIIFMQGWKENRPDAAGRAKLASKTRERLAQVLPRRRLRLLNLGLGVAIFALMSATSLVALSPPLSHVFAAGALAPAGIMLVRAARGHA